MISNIVFVLLVDPASMAFLLLRGVTTAVLVVLCGFSFQAALTSQAEAQKTEKEEEGAIGWSVKEADIQCLKETWPHLET